ncbi:dienelactone hydrolase family protein [Mycolicibacterium monacense]|uniref:Carboxymethylenebutenolidase n=1 Tax=Mycolicibacterium monacense TaxID=85693 RepID=A0AAD1IU13_MYCMB|nr:dienelactone hydrolase family protein [Mycolicibacterium monacense]MDA4102905.1 carboxymethylenebutenolidase [Mycolicibacterium monacense DSM 44395]OBB62531.1 carboxymethylenebutenolidase [Mycolicibacterium monacense]ORB15245.1 carboxymethylenebutenolidase [Mycolicibacterium monacense DSM 44395]BBZ60874.1 carboxymethylenebutenolidase [Mycolicibacterium monacense]
MINTVTAVRVDTPDGPIDAALSVPEGDGPWPGVVVVHDAIGYGPDVEATAARIAAAGFVNITPNLYSRGGRARCITRVFREALQQRGRAFDDVLAARDHLLALPQCSGAVGIAGFCMGGQFALLLGPGNFGASAPFYGTPLPKHIDETLDASCPVVASFGRRDPLGKDAGPKLQEMLRAKGVPSDVKVYPDAGHSFANQLPAQPLMRIAQFGYHADATDDAWRRVFAFFDTHLNG